MPSDRPAESFTLSISAYRKVAVTALVLLCMIVVSGAAVRLSGSGLGCSEWPNCEPGQFIEIGDANQAIEQINRLFTGLVSLGVITAVLGAFRLKSRRTDLIWLSSGLVAGVIGQIILGGITVLVDLHPAAVAGHFFLSMVLVVNATALVWRCDVQPGKLRPVASKREIRLSWLAMAAGTVVLAVTGPLVTGSGPHAGDLSSPRFAVGIVDAARVHSLSAWVFCALVVAVVVRLHLDGASSAVLRRGKTLLAIIVAQGAIGYLQYDLGIPAWLVLAHILGATAIGIAATWFHLGLYAAGSGRQAPHPVGARDVSP